MDLGLDKLELIAAIVGAIWTAATASKMYQEGISRRNRWIASVIAQIASGVYVEFYRKAKAAAGGHGTPEDKDEAMRRSMAGVRVATGGKRIKGTPLASDELLRGEIQREVARQKPTPAPAPVTRNITVQTAPTPAPTPAPNAREKAASVNAKLKARRK